MNFEKLLEGLIIKDKEAEQEINLFDKDTKILFLDYISQNKPELLLKVSKFLINKDVKFQSIYKGKVWTTGYNSVDEALLCMNDSCSGKNPLDKRFYSIELMIDRDLKRSDGQAETRASIEELCKEYQNIEYEKAMNKIKELTDLVEKMNRALR